MAAPLHPEDATLLAWRAGDLSASARKDVDAHLAQCEACTRHVGAFDAMLLAARDDAEPGPFQSRRMQRELDAALDRTISAQRFHWAPPKVAAAVVVAVFSGAAVAMTAAGVGPFASSTTEQRTSPAKVQTAEVAPVDAASKTPPDDTAPEAPSADAAGDEPPAANTAPIEEREGTALARNDRRRTRKPHRQPAKVAKLPSRVRPDDTFAERKPVPAADTAPKKVREVATQAGTPSARQAARTGREQALKEGPRSRLWVDVGDLFALSGQSQDALDAYVQALAGPRSDAAVQRLDALVADDKGRAPRVVRAIRRQDAARTSAEGMHLLCSWGLRQQRGRQAVLDCARFGKSHPGHRSVRILSLAAGEVAEKKLHDLQLAVDLYSRAMVLSEYGGLPSTKAILARARCLAEMGQTDRARTDLRLYLKLEPEAATKPDVTALQRKLRR